MKISSPAFDGHSAIPSKYTCEGLGVNPELHFHDVAQNAVSLVLIMEDPDVPRTLRPDGMFDHWVIFNIPKETRIIKENSTPPGIVGMNTGGFIAYYPPCPPDRQHRYFFKLFALDTTLKLPKGASKKEVLDAIEGHIIAKAELMGTYVKHHSGETI